MRGGFGKADRKPVLAFSYQPSLTRRVFSKAALARLAAICDIPDPEPILDFGAARAQTLLPRIDILATAWGAASIDAATLAAMPHLTLIAHGAGSVKHFVSAAVHDAGITVTNAVAANALPVADYTLACILFANKQLFFFRDLYRNTRTALRQHPSMESSVGNFAKTIGIIGASRIGTRVIELLKPFDFKVLLNDPHVSAQRAAAMGVELVELDDLLKRSDVVSLHAPALDSTRNLIDARRLALLRDGATFINTARGSLVEQDAMIRELQSGRIDAFIDVTDPEVLPATSPLYELPNVFLTPHIAGAVGAERERLGDMVVAEIERFVAGQDLRHIVAPTSLELIA